ncbi:MULTISPECIES: S9 family peptidase [Bartonella]|uniref:S9 family peptidase n=1 Tax=Bartonella TaxID=773 RepID=UPI0018DB2D68|nr:MULTISPECIES: S9 family peptidase [Bartonella]MBH9994802.1 S9 family peptidase [Bartonella sp. P0291]MBH9996853.1 S9 family peptidase [Bartonella sp. M0192]MBH9999013.1 S9 family peptidase [Bartonella sp. M0191]MBI0007392.1 S9 family peptidase [Bartonella sp. M0193]MBI0010304.1 S9 family peptidase [Bartonella sp. M0176]
MTESIIFPPETKKIDHSEEHHGIIRHDFYNWLRAKNWQDVFKTPTLLDKEIRAHLEAENAYQKAQMADTIGLQKQLFAEMKGRIKEDDSSVPVKDGPYAYGVSFTTGGEQPHYFRTPRGGGKASVYVDGDALAKGKDYFRLGAVQHSPDHSKCAWTYDDKGSEFYTIKLRDMTSLMDTTENIINTSGDVVWDANSEGFFYTNVDENHRPSKLYYHKIGTDQSVDKLIFEEKDPGFFLGVGGSSLNDVIYIDIHDHETSEVWLIPAKEPMATPKCVRKRQKGVEYSLTEGGDIFYILTNIDGAKDFKIMSAPFDKPTEENWIEVVPHQPSRLILAHDAYKNFLVWLERRDGLPRIELLDRRDGSIHAIAFEEETYSLTLHGAAEYDSETIRFAYSSMTTPSELYDYDMTTRQRVMLKRQEVPSGHEPKNYITRRLMAKAEDGAEIPISLFYHKDTKLDGSAPCLLYGYGAYGISIPDSFNSNALSLVDRGFVYAIAHIRGGKEKGFDWYEKGKHLFKLNTFTDFIACGRFLVANHFTSHDRLIAEGGSAGGMLMGAVANMAPEDYAGIVAIVPFVDVLSTMLDATLPLTPPEWPEWGNPLASKEDYELIASYSPYDNVRAQNYPAILAMAGLTDPRVTYWEPAKWVAKLREFATGDNPILLRTNMDSGHAGASGRFSRLEESAYIYAFILKVAGKI